MHFTALFGMFYTWLVTAIGAKAALVVFAAGTVVTCTLALLLIIQGFIAGMAIAMAEAVAGMPAAFLMAFWALVPANFATMIAAMLATDAAVFACKYHLNLVSMMAK